MVPGDIIEWVYKRSGYRVDRIEKLWSSTIKCWLPIGSSLIHVLVSIDDKQITWMNDEGLFCTRIDDVRGDTTGIVTEGGCVPRRKL